MKTECTTLAATIAFAAFTGLAYSQVDVERLARLMNLPATNHQRWELTNSPSGQWAYDPIGEVVAYIEGEKTIRCLYLCPALAPASSYAAKWGKVYLSLGAEYGHAWEPDSVRFERVTFLTHQEDGRSVFLLKVKGEEGFYQYDFKVHSDGRTIAGWREISAAEYRELLQQMGTSASSRGTLQNPKKRKESNR